MKKIVPPVCVVDHDPGVRENLLRSGGFEVETFGADGAAELLVVKPTTLLSRIKKIGLRRQEKPRSPNGTGPEPFGWEPVRRNLNAIEMSGK